MTDSPYPGTPAWVKLFGMIALIAAVLFVVLHLAGGGMADHMRHGMSGDGAAVARLRHGAGA